MTPNVEGFSDPAKKPPAESPLATDVSASIFPGQEPGNGSDAKIEDET
jgi:hypothetical protein